MSKNTIEYEKYTQKALRSVIGEIIKDVEKNGLPGEHHFYISFNTQNPKTKLSQRLKEKYPEEMTIVLQYQFWGLETYEDGFHVELSFDNIPEKLSIPYMAIKRFYDPSVQFGIQFTHDDTNQNISHKENTQYNKKTGTNNIEQIDKTCKADTTQKKENTDTDTQSNVVRIDFKQK